MGSLQNCSHAPYYAHMNMVTGGNFDYDTTLGSQIWIWRRQELPGTMQSLS